MYVYEGERLVHNNRYKYIKLNYYTNTTERRQQRKFTKRI